MAMPISTPAKVTPRNVATHTMKSRMLVCEPAHHHLMLGVGEPAHRHRMLRVEAEHTVQGARRMCQIASCDTVAGRAVPSPGRRLFCSRRE